MYKQIFDFLSQIVIKYKTNIMVNSLKILLSKIVVIVDFTLRSFKILKNYFTGIQFNHVELGCGVCEKESK